MPTTVATYTNLPGPLGGPLSQRRSGPSRFYLPDHQGNTRQLTDSSASPTDTLLTDAWGAQIASSGTTVSPFKAYGAWGYYLDGANRLYVRMRHLAPVDGRWNSPDPMPEILGARDYKYAANSPLRLSDPSGLWTAQINCSDKRDKDAVIKALNRICSAVDVPDNAWDRADECIQENCGTAYLKISDCFRSFCAKNRKIRIDCAGVIGIFNECKNTKGKKCSEENGWTGTITLCAPSQPSRGTPNPKCTPLHCIIMHEMIHNCGIKHPPDQHRTNREDCFCFNCTNMVLPEYDGYWVDPSDKKRKKWCDCDKLSN